MSITPYVPTAFSTPIANPAVGGTGTSYPYISVSEYKYAPTGVDTSNLYVGGVLQDEAQVLFNTIRRACALADRYVFGADAAAKGASLAATLSVETATVPLIRGGLSLVCDYKPIIQVNGIDIGTSMAGLSSIGPAAASMVTIGRRTIYVPMVGVATRPGDSGNPNPWITQGGKYVAVWSYVNGYPHTQLAASITAGTSSCEVLATDGVGGLLGIIPGTTQMSINDGMLTERFTVSAVSGTTITSSTPFQYSHALPTAPDFLPVTTLPSDISLAAIYITTTLIKTEGDNALVLDEITEPKKAVASVGGQFTDLNIAFQLLNPYRIRFKQKN